MMIGGGMYGKDVYNPNSPDYGDYSKPDNYTVGGGKGYLGGSKDFYDYRKTNDGQSNENANSLSGPGINRTADFQDKNGNGTDDRDEGGTFVDTDKDGNNDNTQQADASQAYDNVAQGYQNYQNSFSDIAFQPVDKDDDRTTNLQLGTYFDQVGKNFDMARSEQQGEFASGLSKDNALFGANLELRNNRELMGDQFAYTQRDKDKTFELTDEFQNREFGRNIGYMAATGEQTRKNYRAQGVESRLGTITSGEQERLGIAAAGDQTRKTDTNRINTQGANDRFGYRVLGDETRRTDTNKITTQGSEDRKNYEFEDNINARGEARSAARSRGLARGF